MCTKRAIHFRAFCMFRHVYVILLLIFKATVTGITEKMENRFLSFLLLLFSVLRRTEVTEFSIMCSWKIGMCSRRVEGRVIRGKTIRRQSPVPRRRGLEIPRWLAAELRLYIQRGLGIERRLSRGRDLNIERRKRSGERLCLHVGLSLPARLGPRRRGRQRRWRRRQHGPVHPVVPRRSGFARGRQRGSHLGG